MLPWLFSLWSIFATARVVPFLDFFLRFLTVFSRFWVAPTGQAAMERRRGGNKHQEEEEGQYTTNLQATRKYPLNQLNMSLDSVNLVLESYLVYSEIR